VVGGSPYGASTITGGDGSRMPSETELDGARFQGRWIAQIASKLFDRQGTDLNQATRSFAPAEDRGAGDEPRLDS